MSNRFKSIVILAHAFAGWALCGAIIGIGRGITSLENTLIIHAIGAPLFFAAISLNYFKKFNFFLIIFSTYLTGAYSLKK